MKPSTKAGLVGIAALALLAAVHQLREMDLAMPPFGALAIGVLPNLAAAIAITFVPFSIWLDQRRDVLLAAARPQFLVCLAISGVGLFGWEFLQLSNNRLVFDPADLIATVVGLVISGILYGILSRTENQGD